MDWTYRDDAVRITYDPAQADRAALVAAIERSGFGVADVERANRD